MECLIDYRVDPMNIRKKLQKLLMEKEEYFQAKYKIEDQLIKCEDWSELRKLPDYQAKTNYLKMKGLIPESS